MDIANNVLKEKLKNVYFIWGRGKTTIANEMHNKYGYYVYSTDDGKDENWKYATPEYQPFMCRDFEKEYNAKMFWQIPADIILMREKHIQKEVTPMLILDLIELAAKYPVVICEGDLDFSTVIPFASHCIYLLNCSTTFDWFNRPDHDSLADEINKRTDLSEEEKAAVLKNAYAAVNTDKDVLPDWVVENNVKNLSWYNNTSIRETTQQVEKYFNFIK